MDDLIVTGGGGQLINVNKTRVKGLEMELNKNFSKYLDGFLGYTYLDAKDLSRDKDLSYTPRHNISYGLTYRADKGYKYSLTGHYVSKRYT